MVGSITADVTTFSDRLPARGETVLGDDLTLVLGGKGANQAVASALAGSDTVIAGCVGSDLFQELTLGALSMYGVTSRPYASSRAPRAWRTSASTRRARTTS